MRFSAQLPTDRVAKGEEFTSGAAIGEMARAAEAAGFDAGYVTEHPFPADDWLAGGGHHALDPFVALTAAAMATTRLRLHTNLIVLPYRNPFLTAKAVASLDVVSGGRVILGVGAGYLEGEYAALGADFASRNDVSDDALAAMKRAWSETGVRYEGRGYRATGNTMLPAPLQKPHPPIWIGGNSRRARRRVAEHAQGWMPFPVTPEFGRRTHTASIETVDDLAAGIRELRALADERGRRDPLDVAFVPFGTGMQQRELPDADSFCDQMQKLETVGVTWAVMGIPARSRAAYCENVARFGEEVIARLRRR